MQKLKLFHMSGRNRNRVVKAFVGGQEWPNNTKSQAKLDKEMA